MTGHSFSSISRSYQLLARLEIPLISRCCETKYWYTYFLIDLFTLSWSSRVNIELGTWNYYCIKVSTNCRSILYLGSTNGKSPATIDPSFHLTKGKEWNIGTHWSIFYPFRKFLSAPRVGPTKPWLDRLQLKIDLNRNGKLPATIDPILYLTWGTERNTWYWYILVDFWTLSQSPRVNVEFVPRN